MGSSRLLTESFTADGSQVFVRTSLPIAYRPNSFTVGGIQTALKQTFVDANDSVSWYWTAQSPDINIQSGIPPALGVAIVVIYEPIASNLLGASVPASISEMGSINDPAAPGPYPDPNPPDPTWDYTPAGGSGIYTTIFDNPAVSNTNEASSIVGGIQRRASVTPRSVAFKTDYPGWRVGQTLPTNHVPLNLIGIDFVVVSANKVPSAVPRGRGSYFEHAIEAVILKDAPTQIPADPNPPAKVITSIYPITATQPYEKLNQLTKSPPPAIIYGEHPFVLGSGGDLEAGVPLGNRKFLFDNQTFVEAYILPSLANPPVNQDLEVDVLLNGVSIFGDAKLVVTSGTTAPSSALFRGYPSVFRAYRGQIITFSVAYINITGTPVAAQDVTVQIRYAIN